MHRCWLIILGSCAAPPGPPSLDAIERALDAAGMDASVEEGRVRVPGAAGALTVVRAEAPSELRLTVEPVFSLDVAQGTGGVARVLTLIAVLNEESAGPRFGLNGATGVVAARQEIPADAGVSDLSLGRIAIGLVDGAAAAAARLDEAAR